MKTSKSNGKSRGVAAWVALSGALLLTTSGAALAQNAVPNFTPLTQDELNNPDPGDWLMLRGNYRGWGYSQLDEVNKDNVQGLRMVWSRAMPAGNSNQAVALAHDGTVFLGGLYDTVQAINGATGELIWQYARDLPEDTAFLGTWGRKNRSVALYGDKVFVVTWDNFVVALDAASGQVVWETDRGGGVAGGIANSTGPIVVNNVVVAGSTCQLSPNGCYVTGHDVANGEELWRNEFIPRPGQPGDETWGGTPFESRWFTGAWGQITYDPDLNLVFYGSSAVGPASETHRGAPGATLAGTNTRWAVRPESGEIVWKHQVLPRDNWDTECTFDMISIETLVNPDPAGKYPLGATVPTGQTRQVLTGVPCKNGLMWQFDAATGEYFWARDTVHQNIVSSIDTAGIVTVNEDMILKVPGQMYPVCPGENGGRDWPSSAYYPPANLFIMPLQNICEDMTPKVGEFTNLAMYNWTTAFHLSPGKENIGRIDAIDVATGNTKWSYEQYESLYSSVLTTAGGLVFAGGGDRYARAIDIENGEQIWSVRLPATSNATPSTFAVDGKQYVAFITGTGGVNRARIGDKPTDTIGGFNGIFVFALPEQ